MKVIKLLSIKLLLVCSAKFLIAQAPVINIGDTLPNISIVRLDQTKPIALSELLNTKLLIIDFWATWCVPCLTEIELLDSLKKKYPGEFNVLMVTAEDSKTVKAFFKRNPQYFSKHINYITNDTFLNQLFPHRGIPHNIWVNQKGVVKSITGSREVKLTNILDFEKENVKLLSEKKDNLKFDIRERLDILNEKFTYRSIFGPRAEGVSGMSQSFGPLQTKSNLFTYINGSIFQLLYCAYKFGSFREELIEINTKDSLRFFKPIRELKYLMDTSKYKSLNDWEQRNTYCYQLSIPNKIPLRQFQGYLYHDLERQFNLKVTEVMAPRKVVEVSQKANSYNLAQPVGDYAVVTFMPNHKLRIKNATPQQVFDWFFTMHRSSMAPYPYVISIEKDGVINAEIDFAPILIARTKEGVDADIFQEGMASLGFTYQEKLKPYKILRVQDLSSVQ